MGSNAFRVQGPNCGNYGIPANPAIGVSAITQTPCRKFPISQTTALAQAAIRFAQSTESPSVFNHSVRRYLFGELLAAREGMRPDADYASEALFLGCVLHDLGVGAAAPGEERFEVEDAATPTATPC
ncbi:MAG TPA: hypothetical protein VME67_04605 [Mycobacterium sp.]|nr:hypothetical protein [Mycobacterium sp.]HTX94174.1 hypothetical protein [Mycobacterium sp.]